jgi:hypothetical protein
MSWFVVFAGYIEIESEPEREAQLTEMDTTS